MLICALFPAWPLARPATPAPALPAPTGTVVNVSTEAQLQSAVSHIASNTTIVLAPGTYMLTEHAVHQRHLHRTSGFAAAPDNRDDVVLVGPGMTNASYGNTPFGIWTGGNVNGVTIANLTIRDVYYHPIIFNAGTQSPHVYNVHLIDAGQQFIKSNPDASGVGVNNGIVEYSVIEYTTTAPSDYTNGVDVHAGANWIIRHNLFRNIVAPAGQLAGPAVLMWNHSQQHDHRGQHVPELRARHRLRPERRRPATITPAASSATTSSTGRALSRATSAIQVADSPNTQVLNNTVFVSGTYGTPIEYRYAGTTGVVIANNLLDGIVRARDGATGTEKNNVPAHRVDVRQPGRRRPAPRVDGDVGDRSRRRAGQRDRRLRRQRRVRPGRPTTSARTKSGATATTYAIAGHVRDASNAAVSGVTIAFGGAESATATTDAAGAFRSRAWRAASTTP